MYVPYSTICTFIVTSSNKQSTPRPILVTHFVSLASLHVTFAEEIIRGEFIFSTFVNDYETKIEYSAEGAIVKASKAPSKWSTRGVPLLIPSHQCFFIVFSYSCATLSGSYPALQLGADIVLVVACSHVRLLGVDISCDLSLDHHVSRICASCYYRLGQLRRLRRSLDSNSLATLVYAVVNITDWLLQHCSCWCTTDSNGQVTACVERCCACRHRHLEVWPRPGSDTARRTSLARSPRLGVFQAGSDNSPVSECAHRHTCRTTAFRPPVSTLGSTCIPPTANYILAVPRYRLNTYGRRDYSVVGPKVWNSLPDFIRDPTISADCFIRLLDTSAFSALEVLDDSRTL